MEQNHVLLNHLDKPARFLFFTLDEFVCLGVPTFTGMVMQWLTTGFLAGLCFYFGLRALKKQFPYGSLRKILYWYLPNGHKAFRIKIPSDIREWV
jgi:type IV conjugative transfer system protein TraL